MDHVAGDEGLDEENLVSCDDGMIVAGEISIETQCNLIRETLGCLKISKKLILEYFPIS